MHGDVTIAARYYLAVCSFYASSGSLNTAFYVIKVQNFDSNDMHKTRWLHGLLGNM
jgi:hypothetical protein